MCRRYKLEVGERRLPPSRLSVIPVTHAPASDARKRAAPARV